MNNKLPKGMTIATYLMLIVMFKTGCVGGFSDEKSAPVSGDKQAAMQLYTGNWLLVPIAVAVIITRGCWNSVLTISNCCRGRRQAVFLSLNKYRFCTISVAFSKLSIFDFGLLSF